VTAIAEKTLPKQRNATTEYKDVIPPPKIGDERIYTEAPNPDAGHKEEVIPPPDTSGGGYPNVEHPLLWEAKACPAGPGSELLRG
jgi:hypothetical protein